MNKKQKKMLFRILLTAVLLVAFHFIPGSSVFRFFLYLVPYAVIGWDIVLKAAKGIGNRQVFDENFLMCVATLGAFAIGLLRTGDYEEAVAVMLFYQIGELFQSYAVGKSRRNISELMDIRPDYANIEENGQLVKTDPEEIVVGTVITVLPGEKVPIDGVVLEGSASLNTSALTGESVPRDVKPGDEIVSGCIDMSGVLKVRTTREFGDSTVSKVLDLVENASSRKSLVYPGRGVRRRCPGGAAAPFPPGGRIGSRLGRMDLSGADLPGHQLPLRPGDQHSPELLRRPRRRGQSRHPDQGLQLSGSHGPYRRRGLRQNRHPDPGGV